MNGANLTLPPSVISKVDVARLLIEVEQIDAQQTADAVREKVGATTHSNVAMSQQLTDFLAGNQLTLGAGPERSDELVATDGASHLERHGSALDCATTVAACQRCLRNSQVPAKLSTR